MDERRHAAWPASGVEHTQFGIWWPHRCDVLLVEKLVVVIRESPRPLSVRVLFHREYVVPWPLAQYTAVRCQPQRVITYNSLASPTLNPAPSSQLWFTVMVIVDL